MKAHELLADKSKWTTGARGRNRAGESVGALADDAVSWCANGAIERCYGRGWDEQGKKVRQLCLARHDIPMSQVNDRRGYEEVMAILIEANV